MSASQLCKRRFLGAMFVPQTHRRQRLDTCHVSIYTHLAVIASRPWERGIIVPAANWYMNGRGLSEDIVTALCCWCCCWLW